MKHVEMIGNWEGAPGTDKQGLPIPTETFIKNVRDNCLLDLPNQGIEKEHDRIMIMVCGGPTAKQNIEEIRSKNQDDKYDIFCSNLTHDWLISEGIIPDYDFIIDPKPSKIDDVQHPHPDVTYLIGICCDPGVFKALEGYNVKRIYSVTGLGEPKDYEIVKVLFPYEDIALLSGGTMAGLRAMTLADLMGYQRVEFYGFDSCYFDHGPDGLPIYYSYDKQRKENITEVETANGEKFLTSPVFASQASQFIQWKNQLEWIDFVIHGHSLTKVINDLENEAKKPKHDLLITEYHKKMNRELHFKELREEEKTKEDQKDQYGYSGSAYAGAVSVIVGKILERNNGHATVLDYGCGKCTLEKTMPPIKGMIFKNYDPCLDGLNAKPNPADLVVCTDVLEHIEPECLENVLDDLKRLTKQLLFLSVATVPAKKVYSDGQNAHKIAQEYQWWLPKLKKRFHIAEIKVNKDRNFECVCQAKGLKV